MTVTPGPPPGLGRGVTERAQRPRIVPPNRSRSAASMAAWTAVVSSSVSMGSGRAVDQGVGQAVVAWRHRRAAVDVEEPQLSEQRRADRADRLGHRRLGHFVARHDHGQVHRHARKRGSAATVGSALAQRTSASKSSSAAYTALPSSSKRSATSGCTCRARPELLIRVPELPHRRCICGAHNRAAPVVKRRCRAGVK